MRTSQGCMLFGAYQALGAIRNSVILFHSVIGCNFGTMGMHIQCSMSDVKQTCTVISDKEVVFGGDKAVSKALDSIEELYAPEVIFVITGCIPGMTEDDIDDAILSFNGKARVIRIDAPGFEGREDKGYEKALLALTCLIEDRDRSETPSINVIGIGYDDPRAKADIKAMEELLSGKVRLNAAVGHCSSDDIKELSGASLNIAIGRGTALCEYMKDRYGIPYEIIDYPYGYMGADSLYSLLEKHFDVDYSAEREAFRKETVEYLKNIYMYVQNMYAMPVAVNARSEKARGLFTFLSEELGMEVCVLNEKDGQNDLEDYFDRVRESEAAIMFGSSFDLELAEELELPLMRIDYPVLDRICITDRPYVGARGTACFMEDLLNEIMQARKLHGGLYQ